MLSASFIPGFLAVLVLGPALGWPVCALMLLVLGVLGTTTPLQLRYDRLRFVKPVFIGDTIQAKVVIAEKRPHKRPDLGFVIERLETINQRGETVLVCDHLLLAQRREPLAPDEN